MKALVISGGGSKGAFGGGVAQFLLQEKKHTYDLLVGTSTGSLLIPHLALGKIDKIKEIYTNVSMNHIFDVNPFVVRHKNGIDSVGINHFHVALQFFRGRRKFGESRHLRDYIMKHFTEEEFHQVKASPTNIVIAVTNLSRHEVEYKCIRDFDYAEFCEWIWISCNYVPFMTLVTKEGYDYGDGGFSSLVPIREAIQRGATEIDVVILETEVQKQPKNIRGNPFSLMVDLFQTLLIQVEKNDITIGKLAAKYKDVKLNLFYTPTQLTDNALVFNKEKMREWWEQGFASAKQKADDRSEHLI